MYCTRRETTELLRNAACIAIVGAGFWGEKIISDLKKDRMDFDSVKLAIFDNKKAGQTLCGYPVSSPRLMDDDRYSSVITGCLSTVRESMMH